jgi:hypothetical protein
VGAGTSAFSWGPVNLPIGAVAMMYNDNGIRTFTITGNADLSARTISLRAFQPQGSDLKMIIRPGGRQFTSAIWPPMTNIGPTKVMVNGSSLLLRASGVLSGIKVSFEAVKFVDLAGLFGSIETFVTETVNSATNTTNNNTTNNTTNNNTNNNTSNDPSTEQPGGSSAPVAGFVTLQPGESAIVVFRSPQASPNYAIALTPMNQANAQVTAVYSDKTVTGFKIHLKGTGSGAIRVDWLITPYNN